MMPGRMILEKLIVQHVGHPGERMPVARISDIEGPGKALRGQTCLHVRVLGHVDIVIVVDEAISEHGRVDGKRHHHEQNAYQQHMVIFAQRPGGGIFSDSSLMNCGCGLPPNFRHSSTSFHAWA